MINHWFEPVFPYNLINDLGSYSIVLLFFIYFYQKKIIEKKHLILFSVLMLTPFIFNGFLFHWTYFPDQSKYLGETNEAREYIFDIFSGNGFKFPTYTEILSDIKLDTAAFVYAFSPILSFDTYKSIAIWNRGLFLFMVIFFIKNKFFKPDLTLLLIVSPSLIFFSSVSLRDNLVIISMLMIIYFFFQKKFFLLFLSITFLAMVKLQNLMIIIFFLIFKLLFSVNKNKPMHFFGILFFLTCLIFYNNIVTNNIITNNFNLLIDEINRIRAGFFLEEYGAYQSFSTEKISKNYSLDISSKSIIMVLSEFINFVFSPIQKLSNIFNALIFLEGIFFYCIFYYLFSRNFIKFTKISMIWLCTLILSLLMYSIVIINDAQIHRYKIPIMIFSIYGYASHLKKVKK